MSGLTAEQIGTLHPIVQASAVLSFAGSLFIIVTYLFVDSFRRPSNRIVFYMSWGDLIGSIGTFLASWPTQWGIRSVCTAQGWMMNTFLLSANLWSACLALQVLLATRKGTTPEKLQSYERWFHIFSWGIPIALSTILLFIAPDVYGDATFWCWIVPQYTTYRLFFFYVWLWVVFVFNLGVYMWVGYVLMRTHQRVQKLAPGGNNSGKWTPSAGMRTYAIKTSFFILGFFINWLWGSVNRIQNFLEPGKAIYVLFVLHGIFTPLQGFINFLAYFLIHYVYRKKVSGNGSTNLSHPADDDEDSANAYAAQGKFATGVTAADTYKISGQDYSSYIQQPPVPPFTYHSRTDSDSSTAANNTPPNNLALPVGAHVAQTNRTPAIQYASLTINTNYNGHYGGGPVSAGISRTPPSSAVGTSPHAQSEVGTQWAPAMRNTGNNPYSVATDIGQWTQPQPLQRPGFAGSDMEGVGLLSNTQSPLGQSITPATTNGYSRSPTAAGFSHSFNASVFPASPTYAPVGQTQQQQGQFPGPNTPPRFQTNNPPSAGYSSVYNPGY
ncbi:hypothetical protein BJ742DRAFT_54450 [Cladochytrium replicatum]|nr:hypothetical protein BJ742DRAFT_54450 [Cladochytrium replicatum]